MENNFTVLKEHGKRIVHFYIEWVDENKNLQIIDTNDINLVADAVFKLQATQMIDDGEIIIDDEIKKS
jgi:hypothetical protein